MERLRLDLFKLNNPKETNPQWVLANGRQLVEEFILYAEDVCKQLQITNKKLSLLLSKEFKLPLRRASKILNGKASWLPLPIIKKIADMRGKGKIDIQNKIEYLRSKNIKVKAEKYLTEELCEIAGVHAADGCLTKRYVFILKDEDLWNIGLFIERLKKVFGIEPKISKSTNENSYGIQFMNKVFGRYLEKLFNFPLGTKTSSVYMPSIIRGKKEAEIAFVGGALTFEASVNTTRNISFYVISKKFRDDVVMVLKKNNLPITAPKEPNSKGQYYFRSKENSPKDELSKWLSFFIEKSEKWYKVFELSHGFAGKAGNIKQAQETFEITYSKGKKVKISDLISFLEKVKQTDTRYLYTNLNIGKTTIRRYLNILNHANIIIRTKKPKKLLFNHLPKNACITLEEKDRKKFFTELNKKFERDTNVCKMLGVKDFRYCKWKKGERGIPLDIFKKLIRYLNFNEDNLNIKRADREIIIFNEDISNWRVPLR